MILPAEALDDVEQMFAPYKVECFIKQEDYESLDNHLKHYGQQRKDIKLLVVSDGKNT